MRILYISHCVDRNGSTIALANLAKGMIAKGVEVGIVMPEKKDFLYEEFKDTKEVTIFSEKSYHSIMQKATWIKKRKAYFKWYRNYTKEILKTHWYIYKIIKSFKPDIVHTNSSAIDYALLGCYLTRTPHIWHIREVLDKGVGISVFPSMNILRKKLLLPFNHNIAITKAVYDYFNLRKKDRIIYDGVIDDTQIYDESPIFDFPYFIGIGYVNHVKGFMEILRQFGIFAQTEKTTHLVIAGNYTPQEEYFQKCQQVVTQYNITNRVHFLGLRKDIYRLLSHAKALVVASPYEGFGFTTTEAMYCNTLVIGRNTAGTKEQFDNGLKQTKEEIGIRFEKEEELPNLFLRTLREDFCSMKERARDVVLKNYTIRKNTDSIYNYYLELIK